MTARRASGRTPGASTTAIRCCLAVAMLLLAGCTSTSSLHTGSRSNQTRVHVVRAGETLYQIAWQHRVDQRDLARWNSLSNPDLIHVGQRLRLAPPAAAVARGAARRPPPPVANRPAAAPRSPAPPAALPPPWIWPTDGQVVTRFGAADGIATGIGIRGREGQPIRAAAAGRVVYAGNGLIGYGQLVIVKHDDTYLSAYGHNSRLLVSQGQDVMRGQTIAVMGLGPERQPRLHFEIRLNGVPVDPLLYLAARR